MAAPFLRGDIKLYLVGENQKAHFIIVLRGGKRQHGTELGGKLILCLVDRSKISASAEVNGEEDGHLAFLDESLDVGLACTGGNIPVDGANVIAGCIFAYLIELHAPSFEDTFVLAGKARVDRPGGVYLNLPDFLD